MTNLASLHVFIHGLVQGVFFRSFISEKATALGLTGWVRNLPNGSEVEVQAEGSESNLRKLLGHLKTGPSGAEVADVVIDWGEYSGNYSKFEIRY
jgi:acylphosphatase